MRYLHLALLTLLCQPAAARDLPDMPEPLTSFGAVVSGETLYIYGGHKAETHSWSLPTTSGRFWRLDLGRPDAWVELPGGPAVQSPGLAAHHGKIYLVGGMQPQNAEGEKPVLKALDHAAVFDPVTNQWSPLPKLPQPRSSHDLAAYDGRLYAVGGWPLDTAEDGHAPDDHQRLRKFHRTSLVLDLAKPEAGWQSMPQPFERRALALVASRGRLVAMGGMTAANEVSDEVDIFDIATGQWSKGPALPTSGRTKGFATAACELHGEVIASPRGTQIFALRGSEWKEVGQLAETRFFHQLEPHLDHTVIALGGTAGGEPLATVERVAIEAPATAARSPE